MQKLLLLALATLFNGWLLAQSIERQVIGSSGEYLSQANEQLQFTVGELITSDYFQTNHLTQGFQQGTVSAPLALEELVFTAERKSETRVELHWTWNGPTPPTHFELDRQLNTENSFSLIGKIPYQPSLLFFQYIDQNDAPDLSYYQVRAVFEAIADYPSKIAVVSNMLDPIQLFPNPSSDWIQLSFSNQLSQSEDIKIVNAQRMLIHQEQLKRGSRQFRFSVKDLAAGYYFIYIQEQILSFIKY